MKVVINRTIDGLFSSCDKADCWGVVEMKEFQVHAYHGRFVVYKCNNCNRCWRTTISQDLVMQVNEILVYNLHIFKEEANNVKQLIISKTGWVIVDDLLRKSSKEVLKTILHVYLACTQNNSHYLLYVCFACQRPV